MLTANYIVMKMKTCMLYNSILLFTIIQIIYKKNNVLGTVLLKD